MDISKKQIIEYTLMPQILPRLRALFTSGFSFLAYFIALVYAAVKLIPDYHPYCRAENIGRFGVRHVLAEAASNLKLDMKHIDQILVFAMILLAIIIAICQVVLVFFALFTNGALAQNFASYFVTPNPEQDLALMMMDMVFGVPGIFGSCVSSGATCLDASGDPIESLIFLTGHVGWPYTTHLALHQILQLYNTGLLVIGAMITAYFIFTVVAETAQTGTPFGKRYSKVWAPIRLLVAFGLLMPLGTGLNAAQYITLYAAKYGSGFATNAWTQFNSTLNQEYLGDIQDLISRPNIPEVGTLIQFLFTAKTCSILDYTVQEDVYDASNSTSIPPKNIEMYVVKASPAGTHQVASGMAYDDLVSFAANAESVKVVFGMYDDDRYTRHHGYILPTCGEITFKFADPRPSGEAEIGAEIMQRYYWYLIKNLFYSGIFLGKPSDIVDARYSHSGTVYIGPDYQSNIYDYYMSQFENTLTSNSVSLAGSSATTGAPSGTSDAVSPTGQGAIPSQIDSGHWDIDTNLAAKGWGGAGIWYNKIAEMNGVVTSAVFKIPAPLRYPMVLEEVAQIKRISAQNPDPRTIYQIENLPNGTEMSIGVRPKGNEQAEILWYAMALWNDITGSPHITPTGNSFVDAINALFGTEGLYSMRRNENVHPLAQLVGVGKSLVESAIQNIGLAAGGVVVNSLAAIISESAADAGAAALSFVVTIAMLGLAVGFVLYYIVPFLPFIYFFFAVGGWVKGIFEAMVGTPLWALAHIRIDGNGLPGQAAKNGYFLILEIFLRPILIVFGLLASILIFGAMVSVLNDIWDLVTGNLAGYDVRADMQSTDPATGATLENTVEFMRSAVDEFAFTIIYAVVVYMIGMSSFKLIDNIPNNIMRWMGEAVTTFNDERENPAESMVGTSYLGVDQVSGQLEGGLQKAVQLRIGS